MIKAVKLEEPSDVTGTLRDALAGNFKSVIVFGLAEDGLIYILTSGAESSTHLVGALETAKAHVLKEAGWT